MLRYLSLSGDDLHGEMNGTDLLREFRERRSEQAFAELVSRYASLVFSVARRRLGSDALAEEAAQNVFIRMAGAPPDLPNDPALLGWLHRTAVHVSVDLWRSETRRQNREQKAAAMQLDSAPALPLFVPELDEALNELAEADRAALLLRYFDGRKMRELGEALGISEDAAKMRVSRSLERLRERLAARGVQTTAALLAAFLAEHALVAAPATLAGTVLGALPTAIAPAPFWLARILSPKLAALLLVGIIIPLALTVRPTRLAHRSSDQPQQVAALSQAPSAALPAAATNAASAEPDPRALLEGIIRARNRIVSGTMEIEAIQEQIGFPVRETNVTQMRILFDGIKRRFEQTTIEYRYVGINEAGERSRKMMEEKKMTRAEAVRAGLIEPFQSRHIAAYDGVALLQYWETDGKSADATIDDPAKGSSRYLFDPRHLGLNTYITGTLEDSLALTCGGEMKLLGQDMVEGDAAWRIQTTCPNFKAEFWVSVNQPGRLLKRDLNGETILCRYSDRPGDPLPIEVITTRSQRGDSHSTRFVRRATDYNILVDPEFCTLKGLGMQVGAAVSDIRAHRRIGYWTGAGLSENPPDKKQETPSELPKMADRLYLLENEPNTQKGLDAALWIVQNTPDGDEVEKAGRAILDHHLQSTNLLGLAERFEELRHRCAKPILNGLLASNPDQEIRAVACLSLGLTYLEEAEYGKNTNATKEARVYLSRVLSEFMKTKKGFARHHYAKRGIQEIDNFFIGHKAPILRATAIDGQPIDTAALAGRVVVLSFFSGYSEGYDHRKTFEKLENQPVTFLGVSCLTRLEETLAEIEEHKLPWPIIHDGNHGPIADAWLINHWTATFVIDRHGIIRARDARFDDLEKAIRSALAR